MRGKRGHRRYSRPNQRLKLTGAASLVLRGAGVLRRPRSASSVGSAVEGIADVERPERGTGRRPRTAVRRHPLDERPATFAEVIRAWQGDAGFRSQFNALLADARTPRFGGRPRRSLPARCRGRSSSYCGTARGWTATVLQLNVDSVAVLSPMDGPHFQALAAMADLLQVADAPGRCLGVGGVSSSVDASSCSASSWGASPACPFICWTSHASAGVRGTTPAAPVTGRTRVPGFAN